MRQLLHACWPLVAVVAFTCVLALQIPRKALFFRPVEVPQTVPYASFVEFDAATYQALMQKVRMSWQMRAQGSGARTEIPLGVLDRVETPPMPEPLALPKSFFAVPRASELSVARASLRPPTLAHPPEDVELPPPVDVDAANQLRERLLALPASLQTPDEESFNNGNLKSEE
ncbi:MAG: hypothetical protein MJ249_02720 [Kiritimatiellae bacterium]|nr:hypothetical protein [Kiritimatiellia bacterium]